MLAFVQSLREVHTMPVDPLTVYIHSHRTWKTQDSGCEMGG